MARPEMDAFEKEFRVIAFAIGVEYDRVKAIMMIRQQRTYRVVDR